MQAKRTTIQTTLNMPFGNRTNMKIAAVDDDKLMRKIYSKKLSDLDIETFESGEKFLAALDKGYEPEQVIMDCLMPYYSGIDTINLMREKGFNPNVMLCTSLEGEEYEIMAEEMNCRYISKCGDFLEEIRKCI